MTGKNWHFTETDILNFELTDKYAAVWQERDSEKKYHSVVDAIGLVRQRTWLMRPGSGDFESCKENCLEDENIMRAIELCESEGFLVVGDETNFIRLTRISELRDDEKKGVWDEKN